jgi:protein-S-isoprenylcysteine O-methyltransferase Ste14
MALSNPLPPTYFFGAILVAALVHFLLPLHQILSFPWRLLGLIPMTIGFVLNLLADKALKNYQTTVKPFERSSALVTDGIFGITRNPMYLGMVLILFGVALLLGSVSPLVIVMLLAVLLDRIFIAPEEQKLERAFGDRFNVYGRKVRRWV